MKIKNSLTKKKEKFKPITPGKVKIYTCGQTVYDDLHAGHVRTYGFWDVVVRYLRYLGYEVIHVQNFTDVGHLTSDDDYGEDKVEKRAKEKGVDPWKLVEHYIKRYFEDTDALHIKRADKYPRATQHVKEMIELNKRIEQNGYAYYRNGNLYFDTSKFPKYDELFLVKKGGEQHRVEQDPNKKNPRDFVLWFSDEKHLMKWPSPWGVGYPGWHIECSAMSMKYLGETFDIHGGGYDHLFVHHPNEIAQSEAATGKKFVNYWLHTNFLTVNGEKMSKSKGNFITARELLKKYDWETIRMFMVSSHYRKPVDYNENSMLAAQQKIDKLYETITLTKQVKGGSKTNLIKETKRFREEFENAMNDDFNTPKALAALLKFSKKINSNLDNTEEAINQAVKTLKELAYILGLELNRDIRVGTVKITGREKITTDWRKLIGNAEKNIEEIIRIRQAYRAKKNYEEADKIREELNKKGVMIEDFEKEVKWKIIK